MKHPAWKWAGIVGMLLVTGAVMAWRIGENQAAGAEAKWRSFVAEWEAKGEDFGIEAHLGPRVPDEENFFAHPYVVEGMRGTGEWLVLSPTGLAGYEAWRKRFYETDPGWDEDGEPDPAVPGELPEMDEAFLAEVDAHAARHAEALAALAEAARRPTARLLAVGRVDDRFQVFAGLGEQREALGVIELLGYAAAWRGDDEALETHLETLLRLGRHLRGAGPELGRIVGISQELSAWGLIRRLGDPDAVPVETRRRMLELLALRQEHPEEETARILRYERGVFLEFLRLSEASVEDLSAEEAALTQRFRGNTRGSKQRRLMAETRLHYCAGLMAMVLAEDGVPVRRIESERLERFFSSLPQEGRDDAEGMALAGLSTFRGLHPLVMQHEREREALRASLEASLAEPGE